MPAAWRGLQGSRPTAPLASTASAACSPSSAWSSQSPAALQAVLTDTLEDAGNEMNTLARLVVQQAQTQWRELDAHLAWCDARTAAHPKDNAAVKKAATLIGIGPVTASASVATVGDFKQFRHAAQFGAWIALVPRQHSSGGKNNLGGIYPSAATTTCTACSSSAPSRR
jgi:transposase